VGLLRTSDELIGATPREGDAAVLIGGPGTHLGQSALLAEAFGREEGTPPPVDLHDEHRNGDFVRTQHHLLSAATDLSDGGLALAAFEMAAAAGIGVELEPSRTAELFGEDQARYLVATNDPDTLLAASRVAKVPCAVVGRFGGGEVTLGSSSAPLAELVALHEGAFAAAVG
jgi:phosphoribosylformylglycinamidine synthase